MISVADIILTIYALLMLVMLGGVLITLLKDSILKIKESYEKPVEKKVDMDWYNHMYNTYLESVECPKCGRVGHYAWGSDPWKSCHYIKCRFCGSHFDIDDKKLL